MLCVWWYPSEKIPAYHMYLRSMLVNAAMIYHSWDPFADFLSFFSILTFYPSARLHLPRLSYCLAYLSVLMTFLFPPLTPLLFVFMTRFRCLVLATPSRHLLSLVPSFNLFSSLFCASCLSTRCSYVAAVLFASVFLFEECLCYTASRT